MKDFCSAYAALIKFFPFTPDDLDGEHWEPVPDFEVYQVSNFGRIKTFKRGTVRILKPQLRKDGYLYIHLKNSGVQKHFGIHRLVAMTFIPNPFNKPQVNHIDGHTFNNYVDNLEWVTGKENSSHAASLGLYRTGEENGQAKLTNEQVLYIRENPNRLNTYELAKLFGVCPPLISQIQLGRSWKKIGGTIRGKLGISDEVRDEIKRLYRKGVAGCGSRTLAKKFGVGISTIWNIVNR